MWLEKNILNICTIKRDINLNILVLVVLLSQEMFHDLIELMITSIILPMLVCVDNIESRPFIRSISFINKNSQNLIPPFYLFFFSYRK